VKYNIWILHTCILLCFTLYGGLLRKTVVNDDRFHEHPTRQSKPCSVEVRTIYVHWRWLVNGTWSRVWVSEWVSERMRELSTHHRVKVMVDLCSSTTHRPSSQLCFWLATRNVWFNNHLFLLFRLYECDNMDCCCCCCCCWSEVYRSNAQINGTCTFYTRLALRRVGHIT